MTTQPPVALPSLRRYLPRAVGIVLLANMLLPNALVFIPPALADSEPKKLQQAATDSPQDLVVPGAKPVTDAAAIRAKLDNVTIYGRYNDTGEDWIEYHLTDGRSAYWEKGCTYPGKWWIDNGQICYAYPNYRNNAPNCFIMFVRPDGGVQFVSIFENGQAYLASSSVKMVTGNVAHLPVGGISPCVGV